jgi:hypothetical protein
MTARYLLTHEWSRDGLDSGVWHYPAGDVNPPGYSFGEAVEEQLLPQELFDKIIDYLRGQTAVPYGNWGRAFQSQLERDGVSMQQVATASRVSAVAAHEGHEA